MAKKKEEKVIDTSSVSERLNKKYNVDKPLPAPIIVPTNSVGFNSASGVGGFLTGKVYRVNGKESVGKTTFICELIRAVQAAGKKAKYLDFEYSINEKYMQDLGVDTTDLIKQPLSLEDGYNYAIELMETGEYGLIVIDSVNAMPPKAMLTSKYEVGDTVVAIQGRLHSAALLTVKGTCARNNCTLLGICQYRANIGAMGAGNDVSKSPGNAWAFYADMAITIGRFKTIKDENKFINVVEFEKNKEGQPFGKARIHYLGGKGIDFGTEAAFYGEMTNSIKKEGNTYFDLEGNKLGVGANALGEFLNDNPEYRDDLFKKISESVGFLRLGKED